MLDNYVGQRDALAPLIAAMSNHTRRLPNMLFLGGPGRGKTTLAKAIADETGQKMVTMHGSSALDRGEVGAKLLEAAGGIFFIDEVHALPRQFCEDIYRVIDEGKMTIQVPKMETEWKMETRWLTQLEEIPEAQRWSWDGEPGLFNVPVAHQKATKQMEVQTIDVGPVTIIGATTDEALLPEPFYSRLSALTVRLREYTIEELMDIARNHAESIGMLMAPVAARLVAERSRKTPRRVKHLVDRAGDTAVASGNQKPSGDWLIEDRHVVAAMEGMGVDSLGLEQPHRDVLMHLARAEKGLSRTTLAQSVGIPMRNLDTYWGDLVGLGLVQISTRHEITEKGRESL